MTRTFVILLVVTALLFIGFYFVVTLYNRFVGGFVPAGPLLPETIFIENFIRLPFGP
ncbi:MAG: hypothetical protein ACQEV0_13955 [Bacillota bacterium]